MFGEDYGLYGCGGGWMVNAWYFQYKNGAMKNSDYAYTSGTTKVESQCAHNSAKIVGKTKNWGDIDDIPSAKAKLATHPLSIAVDADGPFMWYTGGVLTADAGCGTGINHAVVVVGYTEADSNPTPDPDPEPQPQGNCNVHKWWHSCDAPARRLADSNGNSNYWKIQNSWGTGWGDQGFILIEITEGVGICAMNSYMQWVEM